MSQNSIRLGLPFIAAGQIDKSTTHNEALALVDMAVATAVDGVLADSPPAIPADGECHIVGANPQGAWAGHAHALAGFTGGGWRFIEATAGLTAIVKATGEAATFRSGSWEIGQVKAATVMVAGEQVVGPRLASIADPSGGTIVDVEARAGIAAILNRLRQHGLIAG